MFKRLLTLRQVLEHPFLLLLTQVLNQVTQTFRSENRRQRWTSWLLLLGHLLHKLLDELVVLLLVRLSGLWGLGLGLGLGHRLLWGSKNFSDQKGLTVKTHLCC